MDLDIFAGIFVFLLGLCIGSFLNCYIYRMEELKSMKGRSFCPNCKHALGWPDLFPILSFLSLGGKCRYCKAKISWQYPLVEIFTGIIFLLVFKFYNPLFWFYIASVLIIIFVYDLKHYIIPDKVLFPAVIAAFIYRLFFNFSSMGDYLLAVLVASGFFLAIFLVSRGRWMGFGDVKLAVLMGLLLGFENVVAALFIAFFLGAIIGIMLMAAQKKGLRSEMPFGPFLIAGTFVAMLYGSEIIQWYKNIFLI